MPYNHSVWFLLFCLASRRIFNVFNGFCDFTNGSKIAVITCLPQPIMVAQDLHATSSLQKTTSVPRRGFLELMYYEYTGAWEMLGCLLSSWVPGFLLNFMISFPCRIFLILPRSHPLRVRSRSLLQHGQSMRLLIFRFLSSIWRCIPSLPRWFWNITTSLNQTSGPPLWCGLKHPYTPLTITGYSRLPSSSQLGMGLLTKATQNVTTSRQSFKDLQGRGLQTLWGECADFLGKSMGLTVLVFLFQVLK